LEWGATLPLWQQELLRRVLPERDLAAAQIEELAAAAVSESEQQPSVYAPLSLADVPATASAQDARTLLALSRVRSVNALRSDQHLTFGPQLTVIYGDNGSGKSGYARVLKKVYRARVVDDILANLGSEQASLDPCSATFTTKGADGAEISVEWLDGTPIVNVGRFAVLDTACAGTYIRGGALEHDPIAWTSSERGIRWPPWRTPRAGGPGGASPTTTRRGRSGWCSMRARRSLRRPAIWA
jgi:hypothetical protein